MTTPPAHLKLDDLPPERALFYTMIRTLDDLRVPHRRLFKAHGLSGPAFNVLRVLIEHERDPATAHEVGVPSETVAARMIGRDPDVSRISKNLVAKGFIRKARDPNDGRVHRLVLTEHGRTVTSDLMATSHRILSEQFAHIAPAELDAVRAVLRQLPAHDDGAHETREME